MKTNKLKTIMPFHKPHLGCSESNCESYSAYIRVKKRWTKAGEYNSICKKFTPNENVKTYSEIQAEIRREQLRKWFEEKRPYLEPFIKKHSKV